MANELLTIEHLQKFAENISPYLGVNSNIYSLEEKQIGLWVDGKPLYQLTMVFPSNFSINGTGTALPNDMQTALADVDVLIDAEVCRDNTFASFISPYVYKSSGTWYVIAFDNWGHCKWITFRYTKTTD